MDWIPKGWGRMDLQDAEDCLGCRREIVESTEWERSKEEWIPEQIKEKGNWN